MRRRGCYYLPLLQRVSLRCAGLVFGYWQSPRYFEEIEASLREEYRLKEEPSPAICQWSERLHGCESVGVHVRLRHGVSARGQLVSQGTADSGRREAQLDYYRTAIAGMKGRVSDPYWFVVSDSAQFDPGRLGLPCDTPVLCGDSRRSPAEDLWLLSQARHKIIGPSTFGWWAAWLSDPQSGFVCVPSVFMPSGGRRPSRGVYASGWIILGDSALP